MSRWLTGTAAITACLDALGLVDTLLRWATTRLLALRLTTRLAVPQCRKPYFEIMFANARAMVEPELTKTTVVPFDVSVQQDAPPLSLCFQENTHGQHTIMHTVFSDQLLMLAASDVQAMKPHGTYIQGTVTKLTDKQAWLEGVGAPLGFDYVAICSGSDYSFGKSLASTPEGVHQEYQVCSSPGRRFGCCCCSPLSPSCSTCTACCID